MPDTHTSNTATPHRITVKEAGDTGMAMVLICLIGALVTNNRDFLVGATVLLVINMTWPKLYTPVAKVWFGFSHLLGTVMSKVILALIFFVILTPLALFRRALGHDPMALKKWKSDNKSAFVHRDQTFTKKEIEHPF